MWGGGPVAAAVSRAGLHVAGECLAATSPDFLVTAQPQAANAPVPAEAIRLGLRLNDGEIATATILPAMAAWVRGKGPPPYPFELGHTIIPSARPSPRPPRPAGP